MGFGSSKRKRDYALNRYDFEHNEKIIYNGHYSFVYKSTDNKGEDPNELVAIKRVNKSQVKRRIQDVKAQKRFFNRIDNEANLLKKCKSDYCVKLIESFETEEDYFLVMEYCEIDLKRYLYKRKDIKGFSIKQIRDLFTKLNKTFTIMHDKNIIHCDLKLQNILLKYDRETDLIPKLCDFGIGREISSSDNKGVDDETVGSLNYMSPEVLENKKGERYTEKVDLWSIGTIIYELYFKKVLYTGNTMANVLSHIDTVQRDIIQEDEVLENLLNGLLKKNPKDRFSFNDYINHPFWNN